MESNQRPRNKPTQLHILNFLQRIEDHTLEKEKASSANGAGITGGLHAKEHK